MPEAPGGGHSTQLVVPDDTAPADEPVELPPRPVPEDRPEPPPPRDTAPPPDPDAALPRVAPEPVAVVTELAPVAVPAEEFELLLAPLADAVAAPVGETVFAAVPPEPGDGSTTALP